MKFETGLSGITLLPHQDWVAFDTRHKIILQVGGFNSGKSVTDFILLLLRGEFDTAQRGFFLANTESQLLEGVFPDIEDWLTAAGIAYEYGHRPPVEWVEMWKREGIPFPSRGPRPLNTLMLETGVHMVMGGVAGGKYRRLKGYTFGWGIFEELLELEGPEVIEQFLIPRVRCGMGEACDHRHQIYLNTNPPHPDQPHWLRGWVKKMLRRNEEEGGDLFRMVVSSTRDNPHATRDYIRTLEGIFDKRTAEALIDGQMASEILGRAFHGFTESNKVTGSEVEYDLHSPLYVSMDFNVDPASATIAQDQLDGSTVTLGEYIFRGGRSAEQVALDLVQGKTEGRGHWPENWAGLAAHQNYVYMDGDASGGARRVESRDLASAWMQVHEEMYRELGDRYQPVIPTANPSQRISVATLNGRAAHGLYKVHERCEELTTDLEWFVWKSDGSGLDKSDPKRGHWADCDRYREHRRHGMIYESARRMDEFA